MIDDPVSGFGFLGLDGVYTQGWEMRVKTRQERSGASRRESSTGDWGIERDGAVGSERGIRRSLVFIYIHLIYQSSPLPLPFSAVTERVFAQVENERTHNTQRRWKLKHGRDRRFGTGQKEIQLSPGGLPRTRRFFTPCTELVFFLSLLYVFAGKKKRFPVPTPFSNASATITATFTDVFEKFQTTCARVRVYIRNVYCTADTELNTVRTRQLYTDRWFFNAIQHF